MIYTIGANYEASAAKVAPEAMFKKGRSADYRGGSVWNKYEEAARAAACESLAARLIAHMEGKKAVEYKVYGILADWQSHTAESDVQPWQYPSCPRWRDLIIDALILNLDSEGRPIPWPHEPKRISADGFALGIIALRIKQAQKIESGFD